MKRIGSLFVVSNIDWFDSVFDCANITIRRNWMAGKILIITGDGGESYETLYAYHRFQEARYQPVLAARTKKRLNLVIHDFEPGWDTYMERPGYIMAADIAFTDVIVDEYEAVLIIGGRAPEYLRNDPLVIDIVRKFDAQGKFIFSICHGMQVLVAAGVVQGKTVTCYEHVRFEVENNGGTWVNQSSVIDGNIISSQTWQDHPDFFRDVISCLQPVTEMKL
jgi:protease I